MKTFREFVEETEEVVYKDGVYISVKPTEITLEKIKQYMEKHLQGEETIPLEEIHCTICYSPKEHRGEIIPDSYNAICTPKHFSLFNEDSSTLVLEIDSQLLQERHKYFMETYGLSYTYKEYKPHITFVPKIKNIDYNSLPDIDFSIELVNEEVTELDKSK